MTFDETRSSRYGAEILRAFDNILDREVKDCLIDLVHAIEASEGNQLLHAQRRAREQASAAE